MSGTYGDGEAPDHRFDGHGAIEVGSTMYGDEMSDTAYRAAFSIADVATIGNTVQSASSARICMGVGSQRSTSLAAVHGRSSTFTWTPTAGLGVEIGSRHGFPAESLSPRLPSQNG